MSKTEPAQTFDPATMTTARPAAPPGGLDQGAILAAAALDDAASATRQGDLPERLASFDPADLPVVQPPAFGSVDLDLPAPVTRQRGVVVAPDINDLVHAEIVQPGDGTVVTRQAGPSRVVAGTLQADRPAPDGSLPVASGASWREAQDAQATIGAGFGARASGPPVVDVNADPATWPTRQPGDGTVVTRQAGMMGDIAGDGVEQSDPYAAEPVVQAVPGVEITRQPAHGRMIGNVFMADRPADGTTHG